MYRNLLEDEGYKRLPGKQRDAFLDLVNDCRQAEARGIAADANPKRAHPPGDWNTGRLFSDVLTDFSSDCELWSGWERWVGPYAQKCAAEQSRQLAWFVFKILLAVLAVVVAILAYGAWKASFAEFPSWWPLAASAWIVFCSIGLGAAGWSWLKYRGTDWPPTPEEARAWHSERVQKGRKFRQAAQG